MKIHAIVDYSFLYYKYLFQMRSGRMRKLTTPVELNGVTVEKDMSIIYYSIKEIEGFRRKLEDYGHEAIVSVCFDMPSMRTEVDEDATESEKEAASNYKSNRVKTLGEDDYKDIQLVERILSAAGHNTYRIEGYEADDIIAHLTKNYADDFDYTIMYTPDADLLANINNKVGASRFKTSRGYQSVDISNFTEYLSEEWKCRIPYNSVMLFKCTVGDRSDGINGILRFGPKAFDKLVDYLDNLGVNWEECGTYEKTLETLELCRGYLTEDQMVQALDSLSLVRPMEITKGDITPPSKISTTELRDGAYSKYRMHSLVS